MLKSVRKIHHLCCCLNRFLAQNYLAEALASLGKCEEAHDILNIQLVSPPQGSLIFKNDIVRGSKGDIPTDQEVMIKIATKTNRAVVLALLGKLTDAQILLQDVLNDYPSFLPALRCSVYVLLRLGQHHEAKALLSDMNVSPQAFSFSASEERK